MSYTKEEHEKWIKNPYGNFTTKRKYLIIDNKAYAISYLININLCYVNMKCSHNNVDISYKGFARNRTIDNYYHIIDRRGEFYKNKPQGIFMEYHKFTKSNLKVSDYVIILAEYKDNQKI